MKKIIKPLLAYLPILAFMGLMFVFLTPDHALAASSNPWAKAGISSRNGIDNSGIYNDLGKLVTFITAVGGFWIILMLIIGGILLAGSNGNPQRRTAGLASLACSFGGGYVILKAHDIAGYIASFGS